jgi:hypothetical protein
MTTAPATIGPQKEPRPASSIPISMNVSLVKRGASDMVPSDRFVAFIKF